MTWDADRGVWTPVGQQQEVVGGGHDEGGQYEDAEEEESEESEEEQVEQEQHTEPAYHWRSY